LDHEMKSPSPHFGAGGPADKERGVDKGLKEPVKVSISDAGLGITQALSSLRKRMKSIPPPPILRSFFNPPSPGVPGGFEKLSDRYSVHGSWLCHTGKFRQVNEDSCLVGNKFFTKSDSRNWPIAIASGPWIVAVSDGIGGHAGGAEASSEIVSTLAECKRVTPLSISDALQRLNRQFCERGQTEPKLSAMGATVAGIGCGRRGLFAFNVGDSRVYKQVGDRLAQITRDDSEAEDLVDQGLLEPYEGRRPGYLHALTQAVGGRDHTVKIVTHIHPLRVSSRARFLICSDGLTDMMKTSEIEEVLVPQPNSADAVSALFQAAMDAGGVDNITLAVIEIERLDS
jgi:serine/threonine protein phosphatase PrpC